MTISQTGKDKYCMVSLIHGIKKKKNSWNQRVIARDWRTQGGGGGELQVKGYKLSGIRGIISENLMYHIVSRVNNGLQE